MTTEDRVQKAIDLFKEGYNCSQAVFVAFADMYDYTEEQALKISASFGGGIGRMRETCGAACGLFLLAGMEKGTTDPKDKEGKKENYAFVQELAKTFIRENGSINCGELLGLAKHTSLEAHPEERTPGYYAKRPCVKIVEAAAMIWNDYLSTK